MSAWSTQPPPGLRVSGDEPTGTRILLVRHGEAVCNLNGVIGGERGCTGLTESGRAQALSLGARLAASRELAGAAAWYCSTLPRARETAGILAGALGVGEVEAREDLTELGPGEADGLTWEEFLARFGAPDWDRDPELPLAPGGESWLGFYRRVEAALFDLVERHPGELVVAVVHGGVIENAMKGVLAAHPADRLRLVTAHCSMTEIEYEEGERRLLRYNDRAPLAP